MAELNNAMGTQPLFSMFGGTASLSQNNFDLDSAFTFGTSGDAYLIRFFAPLSQTNAALTVYHYIASVTGSPTSVTCYLHAGPSGADDDDRPNSTVIDSVVADATSITAPGWLTFSLTTSSLTRGATYYLIIANTTATPSSNFPTIRTRALNQLTNIRLVPYTTIDGIATDPTSASSLAEAACVIKFSDGTMMGNPYVVGTSHNNNANYRGTRYKFNTRWKFAGVVNAGLTTGATACDCEVYQGSTLLSSTAVDMTQRFNAGVIYFDSVLTFEPNVEYDVVFKPATNSTQGSHFNAGSSPPADVTACMDQNKWYLDGATPGSFTATQGGYTQIYLIPDNADLTGSGFFIN